MITYTDRPELADNEHLIFAEHLGTVAHKIELANRRLARNGIDERFTLETIGQWAQPIADGEVALRTVIRINHPAIGLNGYEFIGTVLVEDGGTMLMMVPGQVTPEGFDRPDTHRCDHCNVDRYRAKSYLVRETATGAIQQIGSTCLELFFGIQIKGLWALGAFTQEDLDRFAEEDSDREDRGTGSAPRHYDPRYLIAMAYVISDGGKGFVSKGSADPDMGRFATASDVLDVINYRPIGRRDYALEARIEGIRNDTANMIRNEVDRLDEIFAFADTLSGDYGQNVQVAARSQAISYKAVGTLVSLVGVWAREQAKKVAVAVEAKAPRVNEFVGQPKDRLKGLEVTVVSMREMESQWGVTTLLIMRDAAGRTFKWFASKMFDFDNGAVLVLDGTVKDHEVYNDLNQTVLTRCSIKSVTEGE